MSETSDFRTTADVSLPRIFVPPSDAVWRLLCLHKKVPVRLGLNRDWRFDRWMRIVADQFEVFEFEVVDVFHCGI